MPAVPTAEEQTPQLHQQLAERRQAATAGFAPSLEGERRLATVMFADISGFTAMAETMDPEAVRDLMNRQSANQRVSEK